MKFKIFSMRGGLLALCLLCAILFISLTFLSNPKENKTAKKAYEALKKVEANTTLGVTYMKYNDLCSEAYYNVTMIEDAWKNKYYLEYYIYLRDASEYYVNASKVWGYKNNSSTHEETDFITTTAKADLVIFRSHDDCDPNIKTILNQIFEMLEGDKLNRFTRKEFLGLILQFYWAAADAKLKQYENLE
jgi:hypothetical protein